MASDETMDFEARLTDHISTEMDKISRKFVKNAKKMKSSLKTVVGSLMNIRNILVAGIGYAAFQKTIGAAAKFEKQMREVSTLSAEVSENLKEFSQGILDLSSASGQSLDVLTKGLYDSVSAGVAAGDALKFLEQATKLAIGGATDTATAIDGMTTILNAFSLEAKDTTKITDAFFTAVKFGKTTVAELSATVGVLALPARAAGLSFQEMLGALSAVTKGGVNTNEAVTLIKSALTGINTLSPEAVKKMNDLELAFKITGEEGETFADVMNNINTAGGGTLEGIIKLIPNIRGASGVLSLAKNNGKDFADVMKLMGKNAGATAEAYAKMTDTFEHKSARIKASFNAAFIEMGNQMMPLFDDVAKSLLDNMDSIKKGISFAGAAMKDVINGLILLWNALKLGMKSAVLSLTLAIGGVISIIPDKLIPKAWKESLLEFNKALESELIVAVEKSKDALVDMGTKGTGVLNWFNDVNKGAVKAATSIKDLTEQQKKALSSAGLMGGGKKKPGGGKGGDSNKEAIAEAKKLAAELALVSKSGLDKELAQLEMQMNEKRAILVKGKIDKEIANDAEEILGQELIDKYLELDAQRLENKRLMDEQLFMLGLEGRERETAEIQAWYDEQLKSATKHSLNMENLEKAFTLKKKIAKAKWDKSDKETTKRKIKFDKSLLQEKINAYASMSMHIIGSISNIAEMTGASAKAMKKIAMAEAIVQGALATQKALATGGIPLAVTTGILAATNVAKIASQAFEQGGFPSGKNALIRVNERGQESVLNARATAGLGVGGVNALNSGQEINRSVTNEIIYNPTFNVSGGGIEGLERVVEEDKERFANLINDVTERGY